MPMCRLHTSGGDVKFRAAQRGAREQAATADWDHDGRPRATVEGLGGDR